MNHEEAQKNLTRRALFELSDAELSQLEATLKGDEALQREADELTLLAEVLRDGLSSKPEVPLTGWQRLRILWRGFRPLGRAKGLFVMPLTTAAVVVLLWHASNPPDVVTVDTYDVATSEDAPDRYEAPTVAPRQVAPSSQGSRFARESDEDEAAEPLEKAAEDYDAWSRRPVVPRLAKPRSRSSSAAPPARGLRIPYSRFKGPESRPRVQVTPPASTPSSRGDNHDRFVLVENAPTSTFSVDVDTASYGRMREALSDGRFPSSKTRIEELINYFEYDYPRPSGRHPISISVDAAQAPWAKDRGLVRIGLRTAPQKNTRQSRNLVFLVDVSGSMNAPNKLPLLKRALRTLVGQLGSRDWISIVVYAGRTAVLLEPTRATNERLVLGTIDQLFAEGSTNGTGGIELAYDMARRHFIPGGMNRVFLATDGDFNLGITDPEQLSRYIQKQAKSGVFLSVLGFGDTSSGDERLEILANKGNGNYAYIDSPREAERVLGEQARSTVGIVAKDTKLQVVFNPEAVHSYRLIGYDNRRLSRHDFDDDTKDAGDLGPDHVVTAFYEVRPIVAATGDDLLRVDVRYKPLESSESRLLSSAIPARFASFGQASRDFRFAASVTAFGMLLRGYGETNDMSYGDVLSWARASKGGRHRSARGEFVELVGEMERLDSGRGAGRRRGSFNCDPPWELVDGIKKPKRGCL